MGDIAALGVQVLTGVALVVGLVGSFLPSPGASGYACGRRLTSRS